MITWTNHNVLARQEHLKQLMVQVLLSLLSPEYLARRIEEEPVILDNPQCKDCLFEALKYCKVCEAG